jgi:hypothetical protein
VKEKLMRNPFVEKTTYTAEHQATCGDCDASLLEAVEINPQFADMLSLCPTCAAKLGVLLIEVA